MSFFFSHRMSKEEFDEHLISKVCHGNRFIEAEEQDSGYESLANRSGKY